MQSNVRRGGRSPIRPTIPQAPVEPLWHLDDVARRLGVTRETVRKFIVEDGLRAVRLGNSTKYPSRDYIVRESWIIAWLDARSAITFKRRPDPTPPIANDKPPVKPKSPRGRGSGNILGPCPV